MLGRLTMSNQGQKIICIKNTNGIIQNIFSSVCRFGHSQVTGNLLMVDKNKATVKDVPYSEVSNVNFISSNSCPAFCDHLDQTVS